MVIGAAEQIQRAHSRFDALQVGDTVTVRRYGRDYIGRVTKIGRTRVQVAFTYGNGASRTVSLEWRDLL